MGNRSMFVGMDVHKETIDISVAEGGRQGEVRHYGVIPTDLEALARSRGVDAPVSALVGGSLVRECGAAQHAAGISRHHRRNGAADHAPDGADAAAGTDVALGAARGGAAGAPRRVVHHGDGARRGTRGSHAVRPSARTHGVCRPGPLGTLQWPECATRPDHHGGQSARPTVARGIGVGRSGHATDWPAAALSARGALERRVRHRVEGAASCDRAVPPARGTREIEPEGRDRHRARALWVHLGDRP